MKYVCSFLGAALLTGTLAFANTAATVQDQFRDLRTEARQVRSAALYVERLNHNTSTTWGEMDRQWNEIKPVQEAMTEHLNLLEAMEKSMTPAERQALETAKPKIQQISAKTHEFRAMLDQNNIVLTSPRFKLLAQKMAGDASAVAHAAGLNVTETASR